MTEHDTPRWGVIKVRGARENNLRDISLDVPKRQLTVFTGVSGSGKSSVIHGCLPRTDPSVTLIDQCRVVFSGPPAELAASGTLTGEHLGRRVGVPA